MASWPLWSNAWHARYISAAVPIVYIVRMILAGSGIWKQTSFVNSITRDGRRRDVMKGPLLYTIMFTCALLLFWRNGPIGTTAVAMMSGGDGMADLVGRNVGRAKLPWNKQKTWAGSIAMFLSGWALSVAFVLEFRAFGYYSCSLPGLLAPLAAISLGTTVVESLSNNTRFAFDDNITVPLVAACLGVFLL